MNRPAPRDARVRFHLCGRSVRLDSRIHAARKDLADVSLAGVLFAPHYAKAHAMRCSAAAAFLHEEPSASSRAGSQLLSGETFHVLDVTGGWAWGFCDHDGYVGYVDAAALSSGSFAPTHRVVARTAPLYCAPEFSAPASGWLSAGALVEGTVEGDFVLTGGGALHRAHVMPRDEVKADFVAVAQRQVGQPYIWGARGHGGIDCSGLLQIALGLAGVRVPRDTDMQLEAVGSDLPDDAPLQRGDLVFFPGHVGIMIDGEALLHASADRMLTVVEPLADVVARFTARHERPIAARRRLDL